MRAIYVVPVVALLGSGFGLYMILRRWRSNARFDAASSPPSPSLEKRDAYDDRIDAELRDLDG